MVCAVGRCFGSNEMPNFLQELLGHPRTVVHHFQVEKILVLPGPDGDGQGLLPLQDILYTVFHDGLEAQPETGVIQAAVRNVQIVVKTPLKAVLDNCQIVPQVEQIRPQGHHSLRGVDAVTQQ